MTVCIGVDISKVFPLATEVIGRNFRTFILEGLAGGAILRLLEVRHNLLIFAWTVRGWRSPVDRTSICSILTMRIDSANYLTMTSFDHHII